jgi:hypothetical protein
MCSTHCAISRQHSCMLTTHLLCPCLRPPAPPTYHPPPRAGKPRGYAFIEYEHKADMKEAYKAANGRKLEGRRILVDVERGRTVDNWWVPRPRNGGTGESRTSRQDACLWERLETRHSQVEGVVGWAAGWVGGWVGGWVRMCQAMLVYVPCMAVCWRHAAWRSACLDHLEVPFL